MNNPLKIAIFCTILCITAKLTILSATALTMKTKMNDKSFKPPKEFTNKGKIIENRKAGI